MKSNAEPHLFSSLVWIDSGVVVSQHRLQYFFHEIKYNGMTSFVEFMLCRVTCLKLWKQLPCKWEGWTRRQQLLVLWNGCGPEVKMHRHQTINDSHQIYLKTLLTCCVGGVEVLCNPLKSSCWNDTYWHLSLVWIKWWCIHGMNESSLFGDLPSLFCELLILRCLWHRFSP